MSFQNTAIFNGAIVAFLNYGNGLSIDLKGGSSDNATPIQGYRFVSLNPNQHWRIEQVDDQQGNSQLWPIYMIRNVKTGTVIDLNNGSSANGTAVQGWTGTTKTNKHQLWRFVSADTQGLCWMIQNVGTGTYIDLYNGESNDGAKIQGWEGRIEHTNPHQIWRVLRIQ